MKTKSQMNHPLGACGTDTKLRKLYEVTLFLTQEKSARLTVPATSEGEARQWAASLAKNLNIDWKVFWEDIRINRVQSLKEGKGDE